MIPGFNRMAVPARVRIIYGERHITQPRREGHTPVTDISIIVPLVTFSSSLNKLISKSTSTNFSSVNHQSQCTHLGGQGFYPQSGFCQSGHVSRLELRALAVGGGADDH
jgi:hypothetical protein